MNNFQYIKQSIFFRLVMVSGPLLILSRNKIIDHNNAPLIILANLLIAIINVLFIVYKIYDTKNRYYVFCLLLNPFTVLWIWEHLGS